MITAETQKGFHYYHCTKRKDKCSQRYIREEELARQVSEHIQKLFISDRARDLMLAELQNVSADTEASNFSIKQQLKEKLKDIDGQLERLLDFYLQDKISREEYTQKKQKLLSEKVEIREKLKTFGRKGLSRFERVRGFITTCNHSRNVALKGNFCSQREFLKNCGSKFILKDRNLYISWSLPFSVVAEATVKENWRDILYKVLTFYDVPPDY
jgi:hypothetical protein